MYPMWPKPPINIYRAYNIDILKKINERNPHSSPRYLIKRWCLVARVWCCRRDLKDNFLSPRIYHYVLDMCAVSIDKVENKREPGSANFRLRLYHRSCLGNGVVNPYLVCLHLVRRKVYRGSPTAHCGQPTKNRRWQRRDDDRAAVQRT